MCLSNCFTVAYILDLEGCFMDSSLGSWINGTWWKRVLIGELELYLLDLGYFHFERTGGR